MTLPESAKTRIDRFLRGSGLAGFSSIGDHLAVIEQEIASGKRSIRTGTWKKTMYTIHEGEWYIEADVLADRHETLKAMFWLTCAELGVPSTLREELLEEMDRNRNAGHPPL